MLENPPELDSGMVVGRFVSVMAGARAEEDGLPGSAPLRGAVFFQPMPVLSHVGAPEPMTVKHLQVKALLDSQGYVDHPSSGDHRGVSLTVGRYEVWTRFTNTKRQRRYQIEVTAEHAPEAPLDLTLVAPEELPPQTVKVVTEEDRLRAEAAARDASESAEDSREAADEAIAARDATVGQSIEVDRTAGLRVTVGGDVVRYDSGWRQLPPDQLPNITSGRVLIRRTLDELLIRFENAVMEQGTGTLAVVPTSMRHVGFRWSSVRNNAYIVREDTAYWEQALMVSGSITWVSQQDRRQSGGASQVRPTQGLSGTARLFLADNEPLPTTLIGTPA